MSSLLGYNKAERYDDDLGEACWLLKQVTQEKSVIFELLREKNAKNDNIFVTENENNA